MTVTVSGTSTGVDGLVLGAGTPQDVAFASTRPTAVRVTVTAGGPVHAALTQPATVGGAGVQQVTSGGPATLDARNAPGSAPVRLHLLAPTGATVSVLGLAGDQPVGTPGAVVVAEDGRVPASRYANLQDWLNAAAGGRIAYLPSSVRDADPAVGLTPPPSIGGIVGEGEGSVIRCRPGAGTGNLLRATGLSGAVLRDFTLDGNRAAQGGSDYHYGLFLDTCTDTEVHGVRTVNFRGVGMQAYNSERCTIIGCWSSGNLYHGFENEQCRSCTWLGNHGVGNDRHGMFVSPGEVGGTGSTGNEFLGNTFNSNGQMGLSVGADASPTQGSSWLSVGNTVAFNTVEGNADFGVQLYRQDGNAVIGNTVRRNGLCGLHVFAAARNRIALNTLTQNCQRLDGWDEVLIESADTGHPALGNRVAENFIIGGGPHPARYGINEATAADGPNVVVGNSLSGSFAVAPLRLSAPTTTRDPAPGTVEVYGGAAIDGAAAGIDNAFGILRLFSNRADSAIQVVSAGAGSISLWRGGVRVVELAGNGLLLAGSAQPGTPAAGNGALYVTAAGVLRYRGPNGTDTQVAPA